VEFDGHGDYIDFEQHQHAWRKVQELANKDPLLLVIYCHGWKNNSQSSDVVKFCDFLGRLASTDAVAEHGYRVHGLYLGWRGNLYRPHIEKDGETHAYAATSKRFGDAVVSDKWCRRFVWTRWLQENVSYWSRRRAAEHKVSSVPMARTVYTCASLVKSIDKQKGRKSSRVLVMGHSFGALMLERALNATTLDPLTDQWSWLGPTSTAETPDAAHLDPLPLDFVLFVNSAAAASGGRPSWTRACRWSVTGRWPTGSGPGRSTCSCWSPYWRSASASTCVVDFGHEPRSAPRNMAYRARKWDH
jgi:hypothetical protein